MPAGNKLALLRSSKNKDGRISEKEAAEVKSIDISYAYIKDMSEIKAFINLERLCCDHNILQSLDVSTNKKLTYLDCSFNKLTSLDVSNNLVLERIYCSDNSISSLDLSNNSSLKYIDCSSNSIISLDLTKNTSLSYISMGNMPSLLTVCLSGNPFVTSEGSPNAKVSSDCSN